MLKSDEEVVRKMSGFLEKTVRKVEYDFWGKAKEEINKLDDSNHSHWQWVEAVYSHLTKKYPWRKWLVAAWNPMNVWDEAAPFAAITGQYSKLYELNARTALVSSTDRNTSDIFKRADECLEEHNERDSFCYGHTKAAAVMNHMQFCLGKFQAVAVVIENEGLEVMSDGTDMSWVMTRCKM